MAVSYTIAKHGVCFPTKVLSGNCGHVLNITLTSDTDNGNFVKIGNWQELDRYAEGAATALSAVVRGKSARGNWYVEVTADSADTLLVYQDPIVAEANWGKRWVSEDNFYNKAGDTVRAYTLHKYDIIELSDACFDGTPTDGTTISAISNKKLKIGN